MRTLRVLGGMVALLVMSPHAAHAASVQVSGDCDGLTVTAPVGSRVIVGLDASPPYEVNDGNTRTFKFFLHVDHVWALTVLVDGVTVDHADGVVGGCAALPLPVAAPVETTPEPVVDTTEPAPVVDAQPVSEWAGIELAPPW